MSYKDYYKILGVKEDAGAKEIENAYLSLAARYGSEQFEDDELTETILNNIDEAYMVLGNREWRLEYDAKGKDWEMPDSYFENAVDEAFDEKETPEEESLSASFKAFIEKGFKEVARLANQQKQHPYDIHTKVLYSLQDAFQGGIKTIPVAGRDIKISIPKGAYPGQQLKLKGQGKTNTDGNTTGDLLITLVEKPHSYFFRNGNNLLYHASIDIYTAILGGKISVPTMGERVDILIPKGLMNHTQIKVPASGMPILNKSDQKGDFFVEIHLEIPKKLTEEEEYLIKRLRDLRRKTD